MPTIDLHQHRLPGFYLEALRSSSGIDRVGGFRIPDWTIEACLAQMDTLGIEAATLA